MLNYEYFGIYHKATTNGGKSLLKVYFATWFWALQFTTFGAPEMSSSMLESQA